MLIRHITAADNVDRDGYLLDPLTVRHGVIVGGRIAALGGPIDASTHLNLDFAEHELGRCAVAERLEVGAPIQTTGDGLRLVSAASSAYAHHGDVDVQERLEAWRAALAGRRAAQ